MKAQIYLDGMLWEWLITVNYTWVACSSWKHNAENNIYNIQKYLRMDHPI